MSTKTILLLGARGFLGSQVLEAILAKNSKNNNKYLVKTLVRPGSSVQQLEARDGVEVVGGDMMDPESLKKAFEGVDVVINTANGYMQGHPEVDTVGANNVADAVKAAGISRYIYCSILECDKAESVEHFWHKKLGEDYLESKGVPFIALRPGAFLDQTKDFLGDSIKSGAWYTLSMWDKTVPIGMIRTAELAQYFADAIELPDDAIGKRIAVGWSRPIAYEEIVKIFNAKLGRNMGCLAVPRLVRSSFAWALGSISPLASETLNMSVWFDEGIYVNDPEMQTKYFGPPPTPEQVIGKYIDELINEKEPVASG